MNAQAGFTQRGRNPEGPSSLAVATYRLPTKKKPRTLHRRDGREKGTRGAYRYLPLTQAPKQG